MNVLHGEMDDRDVSRVLESSKRLLQRGHRVSIVAAVEVIQEPGFDLQHVTADVCQAGHEFRSSFHEFIIQRGPVLDWCLAQDEISHLVRRHAGVPGKLVHSAHSFPDVSPALQLRLQGD